MINFLLKRSSVTSKRPTAAQLDIGELSLNFGQGTPGLFFEDDAGNVRKIGPVEVGGVAPNSTPAGSSGNSIGEMWLDTSVSPNVLKTWDGSSWVDSRGSKGDKGEQGVKGDAGSKGDKGEVGTKGDAGQKGDKGEVGVKGDAGLNGAKGEPGSKGDKGEVGATGATGAKGDKGDTGAAGVAGAKGDKGEIGATGVTGAKGDKGEVGATGATGAKGDKGDTGATGSTGATGDKGDKGDLGSKGDLGTKGDKGDTGFSSVTANITAGTNAQGQGALTSDYNIITTASNNPSGVTLPTAVAGRRIMIVNKGANPVNVFPASGASIDALAANASVQMSVDAVMEFNASSSTLWYSSVNTQINAAELTGTIPSGVLGNSSLFVGTTSIALNRSSASLALTGITSIDGNAATVTNGVYTGSNNALTGANTFTNSTGQTFRQAATNDGILIRGRAGGTSSYTVEIVPTTLTASRTVTLADGNTTLQAGTMATTGGTLAQFAATTSSQLAGVISDETGSGALVFATSPSLTTPAIGAATGTSLALTGGSLTTRAAGTQDGVIISGRAGGTGTFAVTVTPTTLSASRTLTLADGNTTLQAGTMAVTGGTLAQFAATTSAQLAGVISDETGSGSLVFATSPTLVTPALGTPSSGNLTNCTNLPAAQLSGTIPSAVLGNSTLFVGTTSVALNRASANLALTGISSVALPGAFSGTVTLQPTATAGTTTITLPATTGTVVTTGDSGTVTSAMIADGTIVNGDISASAAIVDTKLATISTAGKVSNSATTATSANTASAIVARDASRNFTAGTITATLSGNASTATTLQTARTINGTSFNGSANITVTANTPNSITFNNGGSGGASGSTFNGGSALTVSYNSVGAPSTTGANASGTWGINITGNSATTSGCTFSDDSSTKDNITTRTDSGFWQTSTGTTAEGWPLNSNGWQHLIACTHSSDAIYYSMQIAASFLEQNWYFRNTNGSGTTAWSTMLHSGNVGTYALPISGGTLTGNVSTSGNFATTGTMAVGQASAAANTDFDLAGTYAQTVVAVAALNIDCSTGNYFTKTINGNSTFTVSNVPASRAYSFTLELTHTSGTVTWFSGVEWPGGTASSLTTGKTHLFMFVTDNGGTRWRASSLIDYTN